MLRLFPRVLRAAPVLPRRAVVLPLRLFHYSPVMLKKKSKKGGKEPEIEEVAETPAVDFDAVAKKFQTVVEKFTKQANEVKMGKTNPQLFDNLSVETPDGVLPYNTVAQTSVKGRNFIITVFDPANVKHVVNAVLASELNLNPIADPTNKQMLKVPLPPVTTESKKDDVKHLKAVYEKYKNGSGKGSSLASIRADLKAKVVKKKKMTDEETQVWTKAEALHKQYMDKLAAVLKAAESAIMK